MSSYFQEIITLLLNPPGNLVYHLVLAFSVAGALAIALNYWRASDTPQGKRMVIGFSLLLFLRLVLFIAAGLTWQGLINGNILLPPLDRAVSVMSMVLIAWMWLFPQPSRLGDAASFLLAMLVVALFTFSLVWWSGQSSQSDFMGSWPDLASAMLSLGISTAAGLLLILNRPLGWGYGLGMLTILLIGDVAYLTYPYPEGDISGAVRLAQMVAFPMLLLLPLRFTGIPREDHVEQPQVIHVSQSSQDKEEQTELYQSLFALISQTDPGVAYQRIVRLIAQEWLADLCLLVSPPGTHGKIEILSGYDLIQEKPLGNSIINSQSIPVIASALRRGRALRLPASSSSPDLVGLGKLLEIKSVGHLLAAPIVDGEDRLIAGLILLTPYTKRSWTAADQFKLTDTTKPLAYVLQHNEMVSSLNSELEQSQVELKAAQIEAEKARKENELLAARLGIDIDIESEGDQQVHVASLAALIVAHEEAQETIAELQADITRLQHGVSDQVVGDGAISVERDQFNEQQHRSETQAEGELRLALEEVAHLNTLVYEADKKLLELKKEMAVNPPSSNQIHEIVALVQEIRQPMSSIVGYTDFLLGESIGILGTLQIRFLKRIRSSAYRMNELVDNLVNVAGLVATPLELVVDTVDLSGLIDEAISSVRNQMQEKNIALRMDLPKHLPRIMNSQASLQRLLFALLKSASDVSPVDGQITLRVRLEGDGETKDYVLIQVMDQGEGSLPQDSPGQIAAPQKGKEAALQEVSRKRVGLSPLKNLAEALEGRVWVDSEPGIGTTYSLLFPITVATYPNENGGGGF